MSNLIYNKYAITIQQSEIIFKKWCWINWVFTWEKNKTAPSYTKLILDRS